MQSALLLHQGVNYCRQQRYLQHISSTERTAISVFEKLFQSPARILGICLDGCSEETISCDSSANKILIIRKKKVYTQMVSLCNS